MPSEKIKSWWGNLPKTAKTAFTTAIVAGILTHLFILTNKLFNYNEVSVLFLDEQEMLMGRMAEGRWLVGILGQWIGGNYSMQAVAGLLGAFSEAQAGDNGLSMKHGYAVMQAGMGFGHRNYKESAVFALGGGYHLNDYLRSDLTIGMRGWGKIEKEGVKADSWSIPALWNVYARVPWQQMGIYVMGGLGMSYNRMDGTDISKGDDKLSFAWTAGAGFDYRLNDCWGLDLGYNSYER